MNLPNNNNKPIVLIKMDKLSIEVKVKIINCLPKDQIIQLRLINKEWRSIIDNYFKVYNLAISNFKINYYDFFGDNKLVDCFFIRDDEYDLSKLNLNQFYFNSIKCLLISIESDLYKFVPVDNLLNQIKYLKNLEFLELKEIKIKDNCEIESLNLNCMELSINYGVNKTILINTPKLINLKLKKYDRNQIEFKHPESIKNLEIYEYNDKVLNFINLEYLLIHWKIDPKYEFTISEFEKLIELHLFDCENVVNDLIKQKEQLKRNNLKIFYQYVKIDQYEFKKIKNFYGHSLREENFNFLIKNHLNLSSKLATIESIAYNCLDDYFLNHEELFQFLDKINNLNKIIVSKKLNDENRFENLLKRSKKVYYLEIESTKLISPILLKKLSNLLPKLGHLYFNEIDIEIDYDLLLKFNNLTTLTINSPSMPIELIDNLFNKTNVYEINFSIGNLEISAIHYNGIFIENGRYNHGDEFDSLKELYEYVDRQPEYIDGYIEYVICH